MEYVKKIVAFIDILGFKKLIYQDDETVKKNIKIIDSNLEHVLNIIKDETNNEISVKMFSDCICLSTFYTLQDIEIFLSELAYIQFHLSLNNIFIRGAIASDLHFENERIIFSKGLVKAYELESKAIYPRIIIDENILNYIVSIRKEEKKFNNGTIDYIMKSPDDYYFLDYLDVVYEGSGEIDQRQL